MAKDTLFTPKADMIVEIDGAPTMLRKDADKIRSGHDLLRAFPDAFVEVEDGVTYDVEQATSAPAEKRGAPDPAPAAPSPPPAEPAKGGSKPSAKG